MRPEHRRENVEAELQRSAESMQAARVLVAAGLLRDAESRLYYALYHAAVALLLTEGIEPRTHAGVTSLLGQHFVLPGRLDAREARTFRRLQSYRIEADYAHYFPLTEQDLAEDVADAERFLARMRALIAETDPPA